ncbi:MAG: hypothetical protein JRI23_23065 [Deltaproteobacteria bacterium]|nr:hypothetical protein [Deltaproteobacteria bacterium]MBW2534853.1 hypothetical protein [Deltaproteobacteria bacterium]
MQLTCPWTVHVVALVGRVARRFASARAVLGALLVAVACISATGSALAQPTNARHQAMTHFNQAEAFMKAEAFQQAAAEYLAAYAAVPKPAFLFNAGLAFEAAGDGRKAVEHYNRYLAAKPKGGPADEARARVAKLQTAIDAEDAAAAEVERLKQEEHKRKLLAETHAQAARQLVEAKQYDAAIAELRAAYSTHPEPTYVFRLGEAHRLKGERDRALAEFELYRQLAPTGPHAADAIVQIAQIQREIQEQSQPKPVPPPPPPPPKPDPEVDEEEDEGVNWWWFGIGAALVAGGLVVDLAPNTARDGDVTGPDFIPLPFYAVGGTFMAIGVF